MSTRETRLDRILKRFKENRLISILMLGIAVVVGTSQFLGAISDLVAAGRNVVGWSPENDLAKEPNSTDAPKSHVRLLKRIGSSGTGLGYFSDARFLVLDGNREIAVGEYSGRGRVQRFRFDGTALGQWYLRNSSEVYPPTQPAYPQTMAISHGQNIVVGNNDNLSSYNLETGKLIKSINYEHDWENLDIIATGNDSTGNTYALFKYTGERSVNNRMLDGFYLCNDINSLNSCFMVKIPSSYFEERNPGWRPRLAVDGEGNVYILDNDNNFVYKVSPRGEFLNRFGGYGTGVGQMLSANAIAVDGRGLVYIHDVNTGMHVFDGNGRIVTEFSLPGLDGDSVYDMAFDGNHNLWTLSSERLRQYNIDVPTSR